MTVRDLLRALLLPSANDAAVTLAVGISGSVAGVRRGDERARRRSSGCATRSYANPIGLDDADNHSSRARPREARRRPAAQRVPAPHDDLPRATLTQRRRAGARSSTATALVRDVAEVNGVKTGRTQQAGYVLVGSATPRRRHRRQRGARRADARPRATPTRSRCCATA